MLYLRSAFVFVPSSQSPIYTAKNIAVYGMDMPFQIYAATIRHRYIMVRPIVFFFFSVTATKNSGRTTASTMEK